MSSDDTSCEGTPTVPLTVAELQKAHAELSKCMDPREFQRRVQCLDKRVRSDKKFNDNDYKFLREAWVLAELSKHKPFVKIRLGDVDERWPDGYAQNENGEEVKIEVTSAQNPNRPLGADYSDERKDDRRNRRKKGDSVEASIEKVEKFAEILETAIRKKMNEQNRSCALIVEQNIVNAIITPDEKEKEIVRIKGKYAPEFKHLWILWNDKVY